jgi:hypothetical protein
VRREGEATVGGDDERGRHGVAWLRKRGMRRFRKRGAGEGGDIFINLSGSYIYAAIILGMVGFKPVS